MFQVGNGKIIGWLGEDKYYIGRSGYGKIGSALANRFVIGRDGTRDEVIAKYRKWLEGIIKGKKGFAWEEFVALQQRYRNGEKLTLVCYCYPLPCHGNVLLEFILNQ